MQVQSTTQSITTDPVNGHGGKALLTGGLAALFASTCCLGPLVLIMVGISGAWISHLTALAPYQPFFIGVSVVALFFAARKIWKPAVACESGQICATPGIRRAYKVLFGVVVLLLVAAMGFPFIAHWFY
ncbi:mercuric ion transporter MerT [Hydrogenophaga sp.]|uniref:mercuric ion transporter MerT n=1 Tax=Hydrogenophaga sp. TaxID=1904254 RepID=UPI0025BF8232|nr:mercuric ion transporter MerT [Hydrogenophaga sp.]MBT9465266.1 mercuric ion transporter MerT [Hydrogenophaga sp.]